MDAAELLASKSLREASITVAVNRDGGTAELKFRALPRRAYRDLLDAHPSTEEGTDWNMETFPPALIAACSIDPVFTVEQATEMWEEWESGELGRMFLLCWQLNENQTALSFGLPGSGRTTGSGKKSATAPSKASRTRRS